jgi:hypothetical protein
MKLSPTFTSLDMFKVGKWIRIKYKPGLGRMSGLVYDGLSGIIVGNLFEKIHIMLDEVSRIKVRKYNEKNNSGFRIDPVIPKSSLVKSNSAKMLENE